MSISSDKNHFFQTTTSLEKDTLRALKSQNKFGSPIDVAAKILHMIPDPRGPNCLFVACSNALARRVDFSTGTKGNETFRGHTAPVTSLALDHPTNPTTLYTGSWDTTIRSHSLTTGKPLLTFAQHHTDFIKFLLHLPPQPTAPTSPPSKYPSGLLLSASADAQIILWDPSTGEKLAVLLGHERAVTCLALDPTSVSPYHAHSADGEGEYVIYSGDSLFHILEWRIPHHPPPGGVYKPILTPHAEPLTPHKTSIYALAFGGEEMEELWTASADGGVKCLVPTTDTTTSTASRTSITPDTDFLHPDFVKSLALDNTSHTYVVTACRDENVRVWDRSDGRLVATFRGHYEEVTSVVVVGKWVYSAGIDGTVRRWGLEREEMGRWRGEGVVDWKKEVGGEAGGKEKEGGKKGTMLTLEEERELEELMGSDDED